MVAYLLPRFISDVHFDVKSPHALILLVCEVNMVENLEIEHCVDPEDKTHEHSDM